MPWQNRSKKRIVLGVTGSFGSGKTTVARILGSYGAKLIDADNIAHRVINPGTKAYKKIVDLFGRGIIQKDSKVDRKKLARAVFNNKNLLKRLNSIVHPQVIRIINKRIKKTAVGIVILDAPLLLEAGLKGIVDKLIVVKTNREKQIKRIRAKTSLSRQDILKRIRCQIPLRAKARLADFVIDNSGKITETKKKLERIRRLLWKSWISEI